MKFKSFSHFEFLINFGCLKCGKKLAVGSYSSAFPLHCPYCGLRYAEHSQILLPEGAERPPQRPKPLDLRFYNKLTDITRKIQYIERRFHHLFKYRGDILNDIEDMQARMRQFMNSERFHRILSHAEKHERNLAQKYAKGISDDIDHMLIDTRASFAKCQPQCYKIDPSLQKEVHRLCGMMSEASAEGDYQRELSRVRQLDEFTHDLYAVFGKREIPRRRRPHDGHKRKGAHRPDEAPENKIHSDSRRPD